MSPPKPIAAGAGDQQSFLRAVAAYVEANWPGSQAQKVTIRFSSGEPVVLPITSAMRASAAFHATQAARETILETEDIEEIASRLTAPQKAILAALRAAGGPLRGKRLHTVAGSERRFFEANAGLKAMGLVEVAADGYAATQLGEEVAEMLGDGDAGDESSSKN